MMNSDVFAQLIQSVYAQVYIRSTVFTVSPLSTDTVDFNSNKQVMVEVQAFIQEVL